MVGTRILTIWNIFPEIRPPSKIIGGIKDYAIITEIKFTFQIERFVIIVSCQDFNSGGLISKPNPTFFQIRSSRNGILIIYYSFDISKKNFNHLERYYTINKERN